VKDQSTLPADEKYYFNTSEALISKDIKLNYMTIAKLSGQTLVFVEQTLQGLMD
jgi:hypothetical protein